MAISVSSSSPSAIDSRRAQQLLERALALAEREDVPNAVLACRQAIALAPQSTQGYSMLGLLLERIGDNQGAISAYEKVLQLAPDSLLERESLSRLRATAKEQHVTRDLFVFDDNELFEENFDEPPARPAATSNVASTPATPAEQTVSPAVSSPVAPAVATVASAAATPTISPRTLPNVTATTAPSSVASTLRPAGGAPRSQTSLTAPPVFDVVPPGAQTRWQKLVLRPSFYFRSAPLAVTTVVSLGFLLWAHNYASSRSLETLPPAGSTTTLPLDNQTPSPGTESQNPNPLVTPTDEERPRPAAVARPQTPSNSGPIPTNPGASNANTTSRTDATPARSRASSLPAPAPRSNDTPASTSRAPRTPTPSRTPAATSRTDEIFPPMPRPRLGGPERPDDTVRVLPSAGDTSSNNVSNNDASRGGAPVNPFGSSNRGYVRVAPSSGRPPSRPENRAGGDERASRTEARDGRLEAAIERLSRSLESGGDDTAFRLQQRAQLYLQAGDNSRAVNDFQAAISAYNDMLSRGDRVSFARSGIQACQRGILLAQSRR